MFATIHKPLPVPMMPEFGSIQWVLTNTRTNSREICSFSTERSDFRGICPKMQIEVKGEQSIRRDKHNKSITRSRTTFWWELNGTEFEFKLTKQSDNENRYQWRWSNSMVGEVTFTQNSKSMPSERIFHQWCDEDYPLQRDIPVSTLQWTEDGYWHTIELVQGKKLHLKEQTFQQRTFWLHTRSRYNELEIIDWKEEIIYSSYGKIRSRVIKTPDKTMQFNYWSLGLISWTIQQKETRHIYHVDEKGIPYLYIKQVQGRQVLYFEAMDCDNPKIRKDGRVQLAEKNKRNKRWMQFPAVPEEANISLHMV